MSKRRSRFILKIESFEGEDTHIRCGDDLGGQDCVYCVIVTNPGGTAEIIDCGYRSEAELRRAWPEL